MSTEPRCYEGGSVGGPDIPLPADPARYKRDEGDLVACNRLRCPTCGVWVRHLDRHRLAGPMSAADKQELYDAPYPENTRFVGVGGAGTDFRVYFCRCTAHSVGGYETVELTDYGWSCGGHPQPAQPPQR
jgi:hypothetical protein